MGIDLRLNNSLDSSNIEINIDDNKFSQVITNLVGNALKFTPRGGRVTVSVTHSDSQQKVLISVTDTGVGIAPVGLPYLLIVWEDDCPIYVCVLQENLSRLFQGVVQFSPGTLQQGGGAGWGLYSE